MPTQWWRRILLILLVPVISLSVVESTLVIWSHQTLLDTDRWVATTGPLLDEPRVVNPLSAYLADQIVTTLQIQARAREALPDRAEFLAAPLADAVGRFLQTQANRFLSSDEGKQAWVGANRLAHEQLIAALRGESPLLGTANNMVTLDLSALLTAALQRIEPEAPGPPGAPPCAAAASHGTVRRGATRGARQLSRCRDPAGFWPGSFVPRRPAGGRPAGGAAVRCLCHRLACRHHRARDCSTAAVS